MIKLLRCAFKQAVKWEMIGKNPFEFVEIPNRKYKKREIWDADMIKTALDNCEYTKLYIAMNLAFDCSLRRGEILALQWDDLNFKTGELHIKRQVYALNGELHISTPKTKSSVRTVVLPVSLLNILTEYKKTVESKWLFPSPLDNDKTRNPSAVRKRLQLILERAECKHVRFHDFRHPYVKHKLKKYFKKFHLLLPLYRIFFIVFQSLYDIIIRIEYLILIIIIGIMRKV